jgi:hypothetical protein
MRVKLGPCPVCKKDLHIFDSLSLDDFVRWEFDCKTKDCIFEFREFNYDRREDIERVYKKNIELSETLTFKGRTYKHVKIEPVGKNEHIEEVSTKGKKKKEKTEKGVRKKTKSGKQLSVHYSKDGLLSSVKCSSWKTAKACTEDRREVTCSRCLKVI